MDPTVSMIRVDKMDGSALAILIQYACHRVVFGSDNLQYSADFPGVMNHIVEEKTGGHAISFFLQGAPGDINPYYAVTPIEQDCRQVARLDGRASWTRSCPRGHGDSHGKYG